MDLNLQYITNVYDIILTFASNAVSFPNMFNSYQEGVVIRDAETFFISLRLWGKF